MGKSNPKPERSIRVIKGRVVRAVYRQPECPEHAGNPLIEALPPVMTDDQIIERLKFYPKYDEAQRGEPDEVRSLLIQNGMKFFAPLDAHIDLARRLTNLLRMSYAGRNPMANEFPDDVGTGKESFDQYEDQYKNQPDQLPLTASGFNIIGPSGVGKSFSMERALSLFPQTIHHSNYQGHDFTRSQIVWLKVDCPFDGNERGLASNVFRVIDKILGTTYYLNYAGKRRLQTELLDDLTALADNHYLGVLVIDEIQRLSLAKSGGAEKLLNFFGQLRNEIGLPVILQGNYKTLSVISGDFSQMRRGTGQGDIVWDLMEEDEQWQEFSDTLWRFQYTKKRCSPDDKEKLTKKDLEREPNRKPKTLRQVLYEETQGITDFAVKVYMFAQERAIDSGREVVTAGIIRSVAKDKLRIPQEVLQALKTNDKRVLEQYEDLYHEAFKNYLHQQEGNVDVNGKIGSSPDVQEILEATEANTEAQDNIEQATSPPSDENLPPSTNGESSRKPSARKRSKRVPAAQKGELPKIIDSLVNKDNSSAYEALRQAGYIDSAGD